MGEKRKQYQSARGLQAGGGGVSKAGDILIEAITKHYEKLVFKPMRNTPFTLAKLGNNAGMLGAALLTKK